MKSKIFCLRDQKIGIYDRPFPAPTKEAVFRQLADDVTSGKGDLAKYPGDFDVYEIGMYDSETGVMTGYPAPQHLTSCLAFKLDNVQTLNQA